MEPSPADKSPSLTLTAARHSPRGSYLDLVKVVWNDIQNDNLVDLAAQMSFYFVLSLFPFLLLIAGIVGWLPSTTLWHNFALWVTNYLPGDARKMVFTAILDLTNGYGSFFSVGLLGTFWAASTGVVSLMNALNTAYGVKETRSYWRRRAIALTATALAAIFFVACFAALTLGHWAVTAFSADIRWIHVSRIPFEVARWLATLLLMILALDLMATFLPNLAPPWRWVTPGRLFVAVTFVLASIGFNLYLIYFSNYPRLYGALAGFVILMMWVYVASLILLIGAEIDNALEHASEQGERA